MYCIFRLKISNFAEATQRLNLNLRKNYKKTNICTIRREVDRIMKKSHIFFKNGQNLIFEMPILINFLSEFNLKKIDFSAKKLNFLCFLSFLSFRRKNVDIKLFLKLKKTLARSNSTVALK